MKDDGIKRENCYGIALIGFGGMGREHLKWLRTGDAPARVCGVWDIDAQKRADAEKQGLKVYRSEEECLSDPACSVVVLAVPNDQHCPIAIRAMRAGKHVICEKPAAMNAAEFREMIRVSRETGRLLTTNMNRRVNTDFASMRTQVGTGVLGRIYRIESYVEGARGISGGWRLRKEQGGGLIRDWGSHLIDQILLMNSGKVTEIDCRTEHVRYTTVEDGFHLHLTFEDGMEAQIHVGTNNFIPHPRWLVYGTKGTLQIDDWDGGGYFVRNLYVDGPSPAAEIPQTKAGPSRIMAAVSPESVFTYEIPKGDHKGDNVLPTYRQLFRAMQYGLSLSITPESTLRVMEIMDYAFLSAEMHRVYNVKI